MARRAAAALPWRQILVYGALLAGGAAALQWIEYQRLARSHAGDIGLALVAASALALGIWIGVRVIAPRPAPASDGNPAAIAALGISPRELAVLEALAAGHSNKEIAALLGVSPNTVKTHVARLFEKLDARRRTDAIARARGLGVIG